MCSASASGRCAQDHRCRPPHALLRRRQARKGKGPIAAVGPLTRQRVVETAFAFEGIRWRAERRAPMAASRTRPAPASTACAGRAICTARSNQEVRGMPYCWGCHGSLQQIRAEDRARHARRQCVHPQRAAQRCRRRRLFGLRQRALGPLDAFHHRRRSRRSRGGSKPWDLQPGDALNKPGSHVMLFLRFTADRKAEVMEASPGGCNGRVCRNVYPLASLLARGYAPVRFRALANETVANVSFPEEQQAKTPAKATKPTQGAEAPNDAAIIRNAAVAHRRRHARDRASRGIRPRPRTEPA